MPLRKASPQTLQLPPPAQTEVSFVNGSKTSSEECSRFLGLVFGTMAYLHLLIFAVCVVGYRWDADTQGVLGIVSFVFWKSVLLVLRLPLSPRTLPRNPPSRIPHYSRYTLYQSSIPQIPLRISASSRRFLVCISFVGMTSKDKDPWASPSGGERFEC